ncbi:transcription factor MYB119-like [Nicotiana tomentosiformis]|uniref:transcription factor MYB119-like n=1 Tax=Nicotiana tomentosiformis TaxID=4098 RepID=UPI00051BA876|nr:transcription factor MYB119-like [Nicotiana tomentosiformis]
MESGSAFRPYQNLPKPSPPLTAIDKFLLSHENDFYPFSGANASSSSSSSHANGISWPISLPDPSFIEGFFLNEHENGLIEDAKTVQKNKRESWKKAKEGNSTKNYLVKGQWTDEEDRKLLRLVKQFGERKWAQIAEKMDARAGKQCRERWHNHFHPDIKKDTWSEEEELLLVETHKQLGNKWAEIAKRIPGRTQNSIKNHWNATKRRMNSRRNKKRKNQADGGQKEGSNVLQDYIRSVYFTDDSSPTASPFHGGGGDGSGGGSSTATTVVTPSNSTNTNATPPYTDDDALSLITHQTCDEEMNFMQNLFGKNSLIQCDNKAIDHSKEAKETQNLFDNNSSMISSAFNSFPLAKGNVGSYSTASTEKVTDEVGNYMPDYNTKEVNQHYYCPDIYLSYLLDGSSYMMNQASGCSSGGNNKVEVDLMEMVLSSQGTFNNTFF